MNKQEFNKSLKIYENDLKKLIYLHIHNKIFLNKQQINKIIKMNKESDLNGN